MTTVYELFQEYGFEQEAQSPEFSRWISDIDAKDSSSPGYDISRQIITTKLVLMLNPKSPKERDDRLIKLKNKMKKLK